MLALMERWMDCSHTFHLPFGEKMITLIDIAAITGLLFGGRSVVFDDRMRTLNHPGLRASLRAAISMEPTIFDQRVKYEGIYTHYQEMPREPIAEMDIDVVARAYLFSLLSTTLFTNHGNNTNLALLPPLQDRDAIASSTGELPLCLIYTMAWTLAVAAWQACEEGFQAQSSCYSYCRYARARPSASFSFILDLTGQTAQGILETHLLYEAVRLKLAVAGLSDEHVSRARMVPLAGRGRGTQHDRRTGRGAGHRQVIIKEAKETSSDDLKETTSNMS
ncbi:hypothetical protein JCGZ_15268 [Jatropha curcas]|uniref:Aminotransferase-like plant mobile domain-containing protein n=1 Tax=Jatropha curcas TaxID=180498 RepID=A0A067KFD6_JATCU|nr:hypothetical protein JCGZ_15268 [Jatropha curcas]